MDEVLTPVLALKQGACFSCWQHVEKSPTQELRRCSACKRVSYCSPECQKNDWNNSHKKMCKFLKVSNELKTPTSSVGRNWEILFKEKLSEIQAHTFRNPTFDENQKRLILYEPFCSHCYRRQSQLHSPSSLNNCQRCRIASFCRECPQTHHTSECYDFHILANGELWRTKYNEEEKAYNKPLSKSIIALPPIPRDTYIPLSSASSWFDYYIRISAQAPRGYPFGVTPDLQPVTPQILSDWVGAGHLRVGTQTATFTTTILAALETLFPDLSNRIILNLHLVGASIFEMEILGIFEQLMHLLPASRHLHVSLIGPEVAPPNSPLEKEQLFKMRCCASCTSQGRTHTMIIFRGTYHEYVVETDDYEKPDLAVAFHSGFSQEAQEQWKPTLEWLVNKAEFPTLFTTYNKQELEQETAILKGMGSRFVKEGEENKWKSPRPFLEPMGSADNNVYYLNQYRYIIGGKKARDAPTMSKGPES